MGNKNTKKIKINKYLSITLLFLAVLLFVFLYWKFSAGATTKVIYYGAAENVFSAKGIAVFEEELITSEKKGVAIINYADGERVLSKTHVASIYSGDIEESKSNEIKQLNEKINYLETNMKNQHDTGSKKTSSKVIIADKIKKISKYSQKGNLESALTEADELKNLVSSDSDMDLEDQLSSLKAKRKEAERSIKGKKEEYFSKNAGMIYSIVDGYETIITKKTTKDADISTFKSLWNSKPVNYAKTNDNYVYGKIINNYELKVLSRTTAKNANGLNEGQTVYIRLKSNLNDKIPAVVEKINITGRDALITLLVTKNTAGFLNERKFEFEFIKETFTGLKVPKEAIIKENGETFVYVVKEGIVRKRKIEILYDKGEIIAKEDNKNSDGLLLYDLVIVKSKNIHEGMVIGY